MYISIGGDMAVRDGSIIGIFDLDGCSMSHKPMEYLQNAEKNGVLLNVTEDIPKTCLVTEEYGKGLFYAVVCLHVGEADGNTKTTRLIVLEINCV